MKNILPHFILSAAFLLTISVFMSITLMAGFHILIILPIFYYSLKFDWKKLPKSAWALLLLCLIMFVSVAANQDISNGYKNATKIKYYLVGALSIIPFHFYFNEYLNVEKREKVIKQLLFVFLIFACVATISGMIGFFTGFNPIKYKHVSPNRNSGMFGMLMTYAHSAALLCSLLVAMMVNIKNVKKYVPAWFLISTFCISFIGLFFTYTRGALLAFIVSLAFVNKKIAAFALAIIIALATITAFINPNFVKENIIRKGSQEERIGAWLGAIEAFKERPLLGYGYQNYEPHSSAIKKKYNIMMPEFVGHAHNNFLEILSTTGILGFIPFLAWLYFWGMDILKREDVVAKIMLPFYICFLVGGLTQVTFNDGENAFFFLAVYSLFYVFKPEAVTKA